MSTVILRTGPCCVCGVKIPIMYTLPTGLERCHKCDRKQMNYRPRHVKLGPVAVDRQYHGWGGPDL